HNYAAHSNTHTRDIPPFPTRRSSDLHAQEHDGSAAQPGKPEGSHSGGREREAPLDPQLPVPVVVGGTAPLPDHGTGYLLTTPGGDRKSTRLNSSHLVISYAVFCLKKN